MRPGYVINCIYKSISVFCSVGRHDWQYAHSEFVCLLLLYTIAIVFQLFHDNDMMYEMRRRKPDSTLLPTKGIFKLLHHVGMV